MIKSKKITLLIFIGLLFQSSINPARSINAEDSTVRGEKEFVDSLIDTFSTLVEKNSGDLFTMS
jgi:hypothetical protein